MLAIIISTLVFAFMIMLGNILLFLHSSSYILILLFFFELCISRMFYQKANCKNLEWKDGIISAVLCVSFVLLLGFYKEYLYDYNVSYLYLSTFISVVLYADSIRFKSLM